MCDWTRLYCCNNTAARLPRGVWPADTLRRSFSSRQAAWNWMTDVACLRQWVMRAGCGGRDMYLRLQPLYLGPLTAVNNLATGLNWPTVATWMNFGIRSEFTPKTKTKFGRTLVINEGESFQVTFTNVDGDQCISQIVKWLVPDTLPGHRKWAITMGWWLNHQNRQLIAEWRLEMIVYVPSHVGQTSIC